MLEVQNVTKQFGGTLAVDGLSFTSRPGEIFGLLGPNGAGKSTTIRMIMNILAPDSGGILLDGKPLGADAKDRVGYLPEERGLYPRVTVHRMLHYLAGLKNMERARAEESIDWWLSRFDLPEWKHRRIEELSKGMAQKVQLAAACVHRPAFVFLDEPFAGLDPVSADTMRDAVLDLAREGTSVVLSTHNMEHAERICRRIVILDHGRNVLSGAVSDIKASRGRRSVVLEFDGDISFLNSHPAVAEVNAYPRWAEVMLADEASADDLLGALVGRVSVQRFELLSPSLHRIFVEATGGPKER